MGGSAGARLEILAVTTPEVMDAREPWTGAAKQRAPSQPTLALTIPDRFATFLWAAAPRK